jgi:hypothetical protein
MSEIDRLSSAALRANMRKRMETAIENAAEVSVINLGVRDTIELLEAQVKFLREFEL